MRKFDIEELVYILVFGGSLAIILINLVIETFKLTVNG